MFKLENIKNFLRKIYDYIKEIQDEDIPIYAAALSFYTLFSLVPLIFVFLSIFVNMPAFHIYYAKIKNFLYSNLLPAHQKEVEIYINHFLEGVDNLGILSVFIIIGTSLAFFHSFEHIVSRIICTRKRGIIETFMIYWTLITLSPLGISLSFYFSSFVSAKIGFFKYFYNYFMSFLLAWSVFFLTYLIAAGKVIKVKIAALVALLISTLWYLVKIFFVLYTFYNKAYTTIYGSFSIIFFFFLWIYITWYLYLYGLKLAYILSKKELQKHYC